VIAKVIVSWNRQSKFNTTLARVGGVVAEKPHPADFEGIQKLSQLEGWSTPSERPTDALNAWRHSWPTFVAIESSDVIGFFRALTDGHVTTYIAEILVMKAWQRRGLGQAFLELCHRLYPETRFDLLSTEGAHSFYQTSGFRAFQGFRKSFR
jgi:GNAT superfamily N-acetyltransferase